MPKQACEQLTLFPEVSRASRFRLPGGEEARRMTVTSGRKCLELCRKSNQLGLLVKMLLVSYPWRSQSRELEWRAEQLTAYRTEITTKRYYHNKSGCYSTKSSETSRESDTMSNHLLYRLVPLTPSTDETASLLWRTPDANAGRGASSRERMEWKIKEGMPISINDQVAHPDLWATPNTMDYLPQRSEEALEKQATTSRKGRRRPANLREQVDSKTVLLWTTPRNPSDSLNDTIAAEGSTGQLNPDWVEWLMGFPIGWTDVDCDSPEELKNEGGWWADEPEGVPRVASGVDNRIDRIKALGNAVVPAQGETIFWAIRKVMEAEQ